MSLGNDKQLNEMYCKNCYKTAISPVTFCLKLGNFTKDFDDIWNKTIFFITEKRFDHSLEEPCTSTITLKEA